LKLILILFLFFNLTRVNSQESTNLSPEKLLQKLIQLKSHSGQEKEAMIFLENFCKKGGLHTEYFNKTDSNLNFSASLYPLSLKKPNIIFFSHIDVVPANDSENWRNDPFQGIIKEDTIYGRGAIDCKGLAVMQIYSLLNLLESSQKTDFPYNITFLAVSEEENSGNNGAKYIVENHLSKLNPVAVFGEGGSGLNNLVPSKPEQEVFGISIAEKSSLWLKLEVNKKTTGHSAVPSDLYANKRLLKSLINLLDQKKEVKFSKISRQMFRDLGNLEGGLTGFVIKHINWLVLWPFVKKYFREGEIFHVLVKNTFVITSMGSINSDAVNQMGSGAFAILDCRLLPGADLKKFIRKVQFAVGQKVSITILSESPNTDASPQNFAFKAMQEALKKEYPKSISSPILFPGSTDNNYFRMKEVPTYGIIPCIFTRNILEGIHGVNECISITDLKRGIKVYENLIQNVIKN
jgi:acetylornithine deacetylase/succinyl-diaminopimelate desuccinylase-like protein